MIRQAGDPILREPASPVRVQRADEFAQAVRLAHDMTRLMRHNKGVGLAANQVGQLVRVIVAGLGDELYAMVNPRIAKSSAELQRSREGCLSVAQGTRFGDVYRAKRVTVEWIDLEGVPRKQKFTGIMACIIQHEIDHLDGVLFTDSLVPERQGVPA